MPIFTANHSSYPRIGDKPEEQRLRRAFDSRDRNEIRDEELEAVIREVVSDAVADQEKAGLDLVTDGQIRWYDPISHLMQSFKGVKVGGLLRFFDTNFYFRVPRVEGRLERKGTLFADEVARVRKSARRPFKVVLTGPVTLAAFSEVDGTAYPRLEGLVQDLTKFLAAECAALSDVSWIQVEEPVLVRRPELFPLVASSLAEFSRNKGPAKLNLATYFGDVSALYEKFQGLPVDGLTLDFSYGAKRLLEVVEKTPSEKVLFLGVVDGRSTRLENLKELGSVYEKICARHKGKELYLTSSCGLEYLPRGRAFEKLALLVKLKEVLS